MSMTARATRILMTADTVGGVWTYAVELCRALAGQGIKVNLATMGNRLSGDQHQQISSIPGLQLFESTYKLEWMQDPWEDVESAGHWLLELERRLQPDIIQLNGYCHGSLPWRAPVVVVAHSCVLSWWQAVHGTRAPAEWNTYAARVKAGLTEAALVIAPSKAMLEALCENYGPVRCSHVIPNGRATRACLGTAKEPLILTAGRLWDAAKNCSALAAVARELSWPVYVAGDSRAPGGQEVSFPNVVNLGRLAPAELDRWYDRAAIYVLPARYEPFGLSALEAAQASCALVLGDIPSLREVWGEAAFYVSPGEQSTLSASLQRLIADGGLRAERGEMARRAASQYSPETMTASYIAAYETILATHESSRLQLPHNRAEITPAGKSEYRNPKSEKNSKFEKGPEGMRILCE